MIAKPLALALCLIVIASTGVAVTAPRPEATPTVPLGPDELSAIAKKNLLRYEATAYTMDDLERMVSEVETLGQTMVTHHGKTYTLVLHRDTTFKADFFEMYPNIHLYRGVVLEDAASVVRVSIDLELGVLHAFTRLGDGNSFTVEPIFLRHGPLHVWYNDDDALSPTGYSGSVPGQAIKAPPPVPPPVEPIERVPEDPGNATMMQPSAFPTGEGVYTLVRLRVYFDNGLNPSYIVQRMEDVWSREVNVRFESVAVTSINTDTWEDAKCGLGGGGYDLLNRFGDTYPLTGTEPNRNDRAYLFTDNPNIGYDVFHNGAWTTILGCAWQPGGHAWSQWDIGSDESRATVADQEMAHNFNEGHCTGTHPTTGRYTIMCRSGDANTDETFSDASCTSASGCARSNVTTWAANNMPYKAKIFNGADTSSGNVKLRFFEVRYSKTATAGNVIELDRSWSSGTGTVFLNQRFIGARNGAGANRDFGYLGSFTLDANTAWWNYWTYTLPASQTGTWQFWPAYETCSGCYGPYQWHMASVSVT